MIFILIIIILIVFFLIMISRKDHLRNVNSLNIKYNAKNVRIPNQFKKYTPQELNIKEKINSELSSHPLSFEKQVFSTGNKYPHVKNMTSCNNDSDCFISAKCTPNPLSKTSYCTVRYPNETLFNLKY